MKDSNEVYTDSLFPLTGLHRFDYLLHEQNVSQPSVPSYTTVKKLFSN